MDLLRERAAELHRLEDELARAREDLYEAVRLAHEEGIPIARIAREAGMSRQWVSEIRRRLRESD
jgi:DNA-binding Lrp family transcriptional regulator